MRRIALADFPSYAGALRRSRTLQLAAAVVATLFALLLFLAAPRSGTPPDRLLGTRSTAIVVVDVSASISWDTYARIASTLDGLRRSGGKVGLIFFSDTAYQALPPGTPASQLASFERFFVVRQPSQPGFAPQPPQSPWTNTFSSGTRISQGLGLALDVIRQDKLQNARVVLVSDLDDDASDLESLTSVALAYRKLGVPIAIAALNPSQQDQAYMQHLLPHGGSLVDVPLQTRPHASARAGVPVRLVVCAVLLAAALALLLSVTQRLRWAA
ncbi:MAG TPA: VWA domain-containing protein [Gaiellaceae bacterium]|nr:VWA domain-containing protein [Gaiellaceae bacterium]